MIEKSVKDKRETAGRVALLLFNTYYSVDNYY